jgi:hypothetical protein
MSVTLINRMDRLRVFILTHAEYCLPRGACACVAPPGRDARPLPTSLTLPAKTSVPGLDDALLGVPEIARAVRNRDLGIVLAWSPH